MRLKTEVLSAFSSPWFASGTDQIEPPVSVPVSPLLASAAVP